MNIIKAKQTPIFFFLKPNRGMSSSYVIFFSSILLNIYIYIYIMVFNVFF